MLPNPMPACDLPPRGWWCSRPADHDGSCAAHPRWWNLRWQLRAVQGGSRVNIDKAALWLCGFAVLALGVLLGFIVGVLAVA